MSMLPFTNNYANIMLSAIRHEKERAYLIAAHLYGKALDHLLYGSMLPITNATVKQVNESRLMCYRLHRERMQ